MSLLGIVKIRWLSSLILHNFEIFKQNSMYNYNKTYDVFISQLEKSQKTKKNLSIPSMLPVLFI